MEWANDGRKAKVGVLLTDEERNRAVKEASGGIAISRTPGIEKAIAGAQLKKVVKWLDGTCWEHIPGGCLIRFDCIGCRQTLRREVDYDG